MSDANEKVYAVIADYGLNGSEVICVCRTRPTDKRAQDLASAAYAHLPYNYNQATGFNRLEVVERELLD